MRSNTSPAVRRSRLPVGSSASTHFGCVTSARASATRCRSPPDSSPGRCFRRCAEADARRASRPPRRCASRGDMRRISERHRRVLDRVELRQQVMELVHEAERAIAHLSALRPPTASRSRRRRRSTSPAVGASRPPSRCSSVLLPEPGHADDRDALAGHDGEVDAVQHGDVRRTAGVGLGEPAAGDHRHRVVGSRVIHSAARPPGLTRAAFHAG